MPLLTTALSTGGRAARGVAAGGGRRPAWPPCTFGAVHAPDGPRPPPPPHRAPFIKPTHIALAMFRQPEADAPLLHFSASQLNAVMNAPNFTGGWWHRARGLGMFLLGGGTGGGSGRCGQVLGNGASAGLSLWRRWTWLGQHRRWLHGTLLPGSSSRCHHAKHLLIRPTCALPSLLPAELLVKPPG